MRIRREAEERRIKSLYQLTSTIEDDETQSHMSKFLCVQSSGYLENVVKSLVENYISNTCPKAIKNYVQKNVDRITNLEFEKLCVFLDSFDPNWKHSFCDLISDEQKSALNSIVSQRNAIAHGNPSNITYRSMNTYFMELESVVAILEQVIKK